MSTLASFFSFFQRTRVEEKLLHLVVPIGSSGAVGTLAGNSSFFTVTKISGTAKYEIVFAQPFPAYNGNGVAFNPLIAMHATVVSAGAPTNEVTVAVYGVSKAVTGIYTIDFGTYVNSIAANLSSGDEVHFTFNMAATSASYA